MYFVQRDHVSLCKVKSSMSKEIEFLLATIVLVLLPFQVQLHLQTSAENFVTDTETFDKFKQSNEMRHQVIFDLFGRLGLRCAASEMPNLTCSYLLGINEVRVHNFLF